MTEFTCVECFDTETIDRDGTEIVCPYCAVTIKLVGCRGSLTGEAGSYWHCVDATETTMTFVGRESSILREAARVTRSAKTAANRHGLTGRNYISSPAIAIEVRLRRMTEVDGGVLPGPKVPK